MKVHHRYKTHRTLCGDTLTLTEAHLSRVLDVFPACPHNHQEISDKDGAHKTHHHGIVGESGEKFSGARHIHQVWHDKQGATKESQVVTEALSDQWSGERANLEEKKAAGYT